MISSVYTAQGDGVRALLGASYASTPCEFVDQVYLSWGPLVGGGEGHAAKESTPSPVGYTHTLFCCRHGQSPSVVHELFLMVATQRKSSFQAPLTDTHTRTHANMHAHLHACTALCILWCCDAHWIHPTAAYSFLPFSLSRNSLLRTFFVFSSPLHTQTVNARTHNNIAHHPMGMKSSCILVDREAHANTYT